MVVLGQGEAFAVGLMQNGASITTTSAYGASTETDHMPAAVGRFSTEDSVIRLAQSKAEVWLTQGAQWSDSTCLPTSMPGLVRPASA